jgi:hypothetical protein
MIPKLAKRQWDNNVSGIHCCALLVFRIGRVAQADIVAMKHLKHAPAVKALTYLPIVIW